MIISINPLFYICGFICILTGYLKYFVFTMLIIFVHELGHIIVSKIFKWNISKLIVMPFGSIIIFNEKIDKNLLEEFLITISGPLFQIIFTLFINNKIVSSISYSLLLFNLLPIIPLDGSKILNTLLNKFICFKISYYILLIVSSIFIIYIFRINIILILVILCLIKEIIYSTIRYKYIYNKLLLEKYNYENNYKKIRFIKNINNLYRNSYHLICYNNFYIKEKEYLDIYFHNNS